MENPQIRSFIVWTSYI